eukprot:m.162315 g.162315  ORF g.162315 m.162315 type:complete len:121 (-) comp15201_c0_seq5:186-548(-)
MFHKKYLDLYSSSKFQSLREHVDNHEGHCDDIALNFMVTQATGLNGVVLDDPMISFPESDKGLYNGDSSDRRNDLRNECLDWIQNLFEGSEPIPFHVESVSQGDSIFILHFLYFFFSFFL